MYVQAHLLETTRSIPPSSAVGAAGWIELAYVRASGPAFVRARAVPPRAARRTRRRGHELPRAAPQPAARRDHGQIDGRAGSPLAAGRADLAVAPGDRTRNGRIVLLAPRYKIESLLPRRPTQCMQLRPGLPPTGQDKSW